MGRAMDQVLLQEAVDLARKLWHAYIIEPSDESVQFIVDTMDPQNLSLIGTGKHELYVNLEAFFAGLERDQEEAQDITFEILDEYYEARPLGADGCVVFGTLWALNRVFVLLQPGWELIVFPLMLLAELFLFKRWCSSICPLGFFFGLMGKLRAASAPALRPAAPPASRRRAAEPAPPCAPRASTWRIPARRRWRPAPSASTAWRTAPRSPSRSRRGRGSRYPALSTSFPTLRRSNRPSDSARVRSRFRLGKSGFRYHECEP